MSFPVHKNFVPSQKKEPFIFCFRYLQKGILKFKNEV